MIKIPICFGCKNFDRSNGSCPAYPNGIPDNILFDKKRNEEKCGNDVYFVDGLQGNKI